MALDWSQCLAVESIPGKVSGAWVLRGARMPVQTIIDNLEAGLSLKEITEVFDATADEVRAVLHFIPRKANAPAQAQIPRRHLRRHSRPGPPEEIGHLFAGFQKFLYQAAP